MRAGGPVLLALPLLTGCFTPPDDPLEVDELGYDNAFLNTEDVVVRPVPYEGLACPDGNPSTVYAVYPKNPAGPLPMVVVFHSGSFDYVVAPVADDPLYGDHYAPEDRLSADWANRKVFETLGMLEGDGSEANLGTVPAALADAGTFALYPANCWGDAWHNEQGYQLNAEVDGFYRNGRALAWAVLGMASPDATTAANWRSALGLETFPVEVDTSSVGLVGLGDGGRAVLEVLRRAQKVPSVVGSSSALPPIRGAIVDSACDNYYPIASQPALYPGEVEGLSRIFPSDYQGDIGYWSFNRYLQDTGVPGTLQVYWSSNDPDLPSQCLDSLNTLHAANTFGGRFTLVDTGRVEHVYLNGQDIPAREAVNRMLTGG